MIIIIALPGGSKHFSRNFPISLRSVLLLAFFQQVTSISFALLVQNSKMPSKTQSHLGTLLVEPNSGRLLAVDVCALQELSLSKQAIESRVLADLFSGLSEESLRSIVDQNDNQHRSFSAGIGGVDGNMISVQLQCVPLLGSEQSFVQISIHQSDEQQPEVLHRDALTNLPDRRALVRHYELCRNSGSQHNPKLAVLFMDLDQFKQINDQHGHSIGDQVLCELATRWVACLRDGDLVARYGGDEFIALLRGVSRLEEVEPIANRLTEATLRPIAIGNSQLNVGITIGVAIAANKLQNLEELIAAADQEMYIAKRAK